MHHFRLALKIYDKLHPSLSLACARFLGVQFLFIENKLKSSGERKERASSVRCWWVKNFSFSLSLLRGFELKASGEVKREALNNVI
jgi:hypothetical protein